jgi:hypothetical protein
MSWEVKEAMYGSGNLKSSMRDGWEPFSTFKGNGSLFLMLRRETETAKGVSTYEGEAFRARHRIGGTARLFLTTCGTYRADVSKSDALADLDALLLDHEKLLAREGFVFDVPRPGSET